MRINRPLLIHKWLPVVMEMPRMLAELYRQPELGLLSHELWFSRTILLVQYWKDSESLMAFARSKTAAHLPAFGLGKVGPLVEARGSLNSAPDRLHGK